MWPTVLWWESCFLSSFFLNKSNQSMSSFLFTFPILLKYSCYAQNALCELFFLFLITEMEERHEEMSGISSEVTQVLQPFKSFSVTSNFFFHACNHKLNSRTKICTIVLLWRWLWKKSFTNWLYEHFVCVRACICAFVCLSVCAECMKRNSKFICKMLISSLRLAFRHVRFIKI